MYKPSNQVKKCMYGPGGYYSGTLVTVVTAVLKAVSLSGGHTVATELPTSIGDQAK